MPQDRNSASRPPLPNAGVVEDFTAPFLVTAGVLCFVGLFAVWAWFGLPFAIVLAWMADRLVLRTVR